MKTRYFFILIFNLLVMPDLLAQWNGATDTSPIYRTGSVGIGTSPTNSKLQINSTVSREALRINYNGSTTNYLNIWHGSGAAVIEPVGTGMLYLGYDGPTDVLVGKAGGKVGIGTESPGSFLHVNNTNSSIASLLLSAADADISFGGHSINLMAKPAFSHMPYISWWNKDNQRMAYLGWRTDVFALQLDNGYNYSVTGGKVGIGTFTPSYQLTVNTSEGNHIRMENGSEAGFMSLSTDGNLNLWVHGDDDMVFARGTGSGTESMRINASGNVGIGTSNPTERLTVNGTVYSKEVRVDINVPGPDYVFEKDYNLPTLEEIKVYINQHKHLPEVPSAKEMEENGINVGEMNMILLKKVEELTLHLISQSKQIGDQLERIEVQQQIISSQNNRIEKLEKALK